MTRLAPASMPARNGSRYESVAVVVSSVMPWEVTSVLPVTRPSPGKCLTVAVTPAWDRPATMARTAPATWPGSLPSWREYRPMGALTLSRPFGTTSATGARLTLTPASRSSRPAPAHSVLSCSAAIRPWSTAEGRGVNPLPRSC